MPNLLPHSSIPELFRKSFVAARFSEDGELRGKLINWNCAESTSFDSTLELMLLLEDHVSYITNFDPADAEYITQQDELDFVYRIENLFQHPDYNGSSSFVIKFEMMFNSQVVANVKTLNQSVFHQCKHSSDIIVYIKSMLSNAFIAESKTETFTNRTF